MVMQAKLLRVLEERQVERVGGDRPIPVDVRVIVATHRNLDELVKKGAFRQDLYHRIYVFPLLLPPLRERAGRYPGAGGALRRAGCGAERMEAQAVSRRTPSRNCSDTRGPAMCANCATWWSACCCWPTDRWMRPRSAWRCRQPTRRGAGRARCSARRARWRSASDAFEREQILAELKRTHQRMTDTAKALGLERSHLYKKCQALGIDLRAMREGSGA